MTFYSSSLPPHLAGRHTWIGKHIFRAHNPNPRCARRRRGGWNFYKHGIYHQYNLHREEPTWEELHVLDAQQWSKQGFRYILRLKRGGRRKRRKKNCFKASQSESSLLLLSVVKAVNRWLKFIATQRFIPKFFESLINSAGWRHFPHVTWWWNEISCETFPSLGFSHERIVVIKIWNYAKQREFNNWIVYSKVVDMNM